MISLKFIVVFFISGLFCYFIYRVIGGYIFSKYLWELVVSIDDISNIRKISFIFANELKKFLKADFVGIIELKYSSIKILNAVPVKTPLRELDLSRECFLILKNLLKTKYNFFSQSDFEGEYIRQFYPFFNGNQFYIIPVFTDKSNIIFAEVHFNGKLRAFNSGKLRKLLQVFEKFYFDLKEFQNTLAMLKKNEIVIKILDRIRTTFDEAEIKKIILQEILVAFSADRAYLVKYQKADNSAVFDGEFIATLGGHPVFNRDEIWKFISEQNINPPVFVVDSAEKFIRQNNLEGTSLEKFLRKAEVKSSYPVLISDDDDVASYLVLQYTNEVVIFDKDDFELLDLISKQASIALAQAKLYSKLHNNNIREKLLIDLISILRSSLDLRDVINLFLTKVGEYYGADRCVIRLYDSGKNEFREYDEAFEYKKHFYTLSSKDYKLSEELERFLDNNSKFHDAFTIQKKSDLEEKEFSAKTALLDFFNKYNIQSHLSAFIKHNGKLIGILSLHFSSERQFSKFDEEFVKALTVQAGVAFYQSELYLNIQNVAKKEKLLKEVFYETRNLESEYQIFQYFNSKLIDVFNALGSVFVKQDKYNSLVFFEKYRLSLEKLSGFRKFEFVIDVIRENKLVFNYDLQNKSKDNSEFNDFLRETNLNCITILPVDKELTLVLFFDKPQDFNYFEKSILLSLSQVILRTVKDGLQTAEIKELRESFLATLANDFQVPIVAQKNAIKYLIAKWQTLPEDSLKKFLNGLLESSDDISYMLKILLDIYNYEAGKRSLFREKCNLVFILRNVLEMQKISLEEKNIHIEEDFACDDCEVYVDKNEIRKVISILIKNAIKNLPQEGTLTLQTEKNNEYLRFCISNNGKTLPQSVKMAIFDRTEMANTLERTVGEGLNLYLAKLIILAHGGKIYLDISDENITTFCIELP